MIKGTFLFFFLSSILVFHSAPADGAESKLFGTYRGVLRHHKLQRDQLAKLELVLDRKAGTNLEISGILTLHLGETPGSEYASYFFDNVRYNLLTGTLVFDQADQGVTILVSKFDGQEFEGKVRAPLLGSSDVTLLLDRDKGVPPSLPLLQELGGTYRSETAVLEVQTFRSTEERADSGTAFGENEVRARLARENADLGGLVTDSIFTVGSYDFFRAKVELAGDLEPLSCVVDLASLTCEGERFVRDIKPAQQQLPAVEAPWREAAQAGITAPSILPSGFSGQYWGYVHHEGRNQFQLAGLNLMALPGAGAGGLSISAAGALYFGQDSSAEAIAYKFEPRDYDFISPPVFKRDGEDAIVQVTSWNNGMLRGIWYSKLFGRVGTFEFRRDELPKLPAAATVMASLSGQREFGFWRLLLKVAPRPKIARSANPFSPLSFGGLIWDRNGLVIAKSPVQGGSYDFYTGRIHLPFNSANESLQMTGERRHDGDFDLRFHLSNRFGSEFRPQQVLFSNKRSGGSK